MKRILSLLLIFVLLSSVGYAQLGLTKGVKGGLNIATWGGPDAPSATSSTTQFAIGGFVEIELSGPISIQPEVLYSIKGTSAIVGSTERTQTQSYIDIPVLVKYNLSLPGLKPSVYAGPSLGILTAAKATWPGHEVDDKGDFPDVDFGLVFGVGAKIPLGAIDLTFDARYGMGLSTLDRDGQAKAYNRVFAILAGIAF